MNPNERDIINRAAAWREKKRVLVIKIEEIASKLDTWHAVTSGGKLGACLTGLASGAMILAAPFTAGASLAGALAVGGVSVVAGASSCIADFASTKMLCSEANKLIEEYRKLTQSLFDDVQKYIFLIKSSVDLTRFLADFSSASGITAARSMGTFSPEVLVALSRVFETLLIKIIASIGVVLNIISLINVCRDVSKGSKYANELRETARTIRNQ